MDLIYEHPIIDFGHEKKPKVKFTFDGCEMEGFEGEPISAALHANGITTYRKTKRMKRPRGFFCAIGKCSSCFMVVNGIPNVRVCITPLKEGMKIETQYGLGRVPLTPEKSRG